MEVYLNFEYALFFHLLFLASLLQKIIVGAVRKEEPTIIYDKKLCQLIMFPFWVGITAFGIGAICIILILITVLFPIIGNYQFYVAAMLYTFEIGVSFVFIGTTIEYYCKIGSLE